MTEKRSELYLDEWKSRIKQAVGSRKKNEQEWDTYLGYYKNQMWRNVDEKVRADLATVNLVYPLVSIIRETTFNRNPKIFVKPTRPEFRLAAQVIDFLVNHVWYDLKINKQIRRSIDMATLKSFSPIELGFSGTFASGEVKPHDMPYVRATSPTDFITDDQCKTFDDEQAFFRGFKRKVSYSQFKEMYPSAAKELAPKLKEKQKSETDTAKVWPGGIAPWKRVEYWVVQDLLTDRFYTIHPDLKDFVNVTKNPYNVDGFLSEVLVFNEIPDELWPMSDIRPIKFQQKELNNMRTYMMRHWKKLVDAYIYDKNIFKEEDLNRIINAEDVEFIGVDQLPPEGQGLMLLPKGTVSNDFYQHHSDIKADYREISGISEYYRGGTVPGTKTAYETRQVQEGTAVRLQGHARAVTEFVEAIARKLIQILKDYYTLPIVSQIAGPRGELVWRKFSRWEIQAEVDVKVHLGSTMPVDEQSDKLSAREFYQMYRQDPLYNQRLIAQESLRREGIPNPEDYMMEGPAEPFTPNDRGGGANQGSNTAQGLLRGFGRGTQ